MNSPTNAGAPKALAEGVVPAGLATAPVTAPDQPGVGLRQAAHDLAALQGGQVTVVAQGRAQGRAPLLAGLPALSTLLSAARARFAQAGDERLTTSYAAEWLLDNYYAVEQAAAQVRHDLPPAYYRELPLLGAGAPGAGLPRAYVLAHTLLAHDDFQFDPGQLFQFVDTYQEQHALALGEVWALPIMLRLVLLQHVALASARVAGLLDEPDAELAQAERVVRAAMLPGSAAADEALRDDYLVAHAIPSLRLLDTLDWQTAVERMSVVHRVLGAGDPAGVYLHMDFATRDSYRREIEKVAAWAGVEEVAVAHAAVALAQAAEGPSVNGGDPLAPRALRFDLPVSRHVGDYLLGAGRPALEARTGARPGRAERLRRALLAHATAAYLGAIMLLTVAVVAAAALYAAQGGVWAALLAAALTVIPALTAAVNLVNWAVTRALPPTVLPKLDFEEGVAAECRTLVVIPALSAHLSDVDSLLRQLEEHALRNPDPAFAFAVLSDFGDAQQATMPEDAALLDYAGEKLAALNAATPGAPYYFLHRRRLWNEAQGRWMGWERKRGKLHELNRLLRGAEDTSYDVVMGDRARLRGVRYVITLDADTVLPRDAAAQLVGALAHPLNRAQFDPATGKVTAGYTVLQPRAEIKPDSAARSLFTRVFAGDGTIDLYTLAVSDVYQDLFGAGIYVGKGIYDVDAFERSVDGRVPENTLLSHDLFEGIHGRVGLATDVVVYEEYPPNYLVGLLRMHRWMRGDWQLLPWLGWRTPRAQGYGPNDLALIDRWKMFDNLRRSLVSPALLLLLAAAWTVLPGSPLFWMVLGMLTPAVSLLMVAAAGAAAAFRATLSGGRTAPWRVYARPLRNSAVRWLLFLAFVPVEALLALDAIARTLWRMYGTRRNLLEWTTAAGATRLVGEEVTLASTLRNTLPASLLAAALAVLVFFVRPSALLYALPLLAVWVFAPEVAFLISRPAQRTAVPLTPDQERTLRALARRTWLFYEQFVGPEDNWLPPDHYQEAPLGTVAHRTSPTNVGLYLLSALAAHDRGYLGTLDFVMRLEFAFAGLDRLERHRGHFLNWIDTGSLRPLPPRYVSTVDSGNLAACLVILRQGCREIPSRPVWQEAAWLGLRDAVEMLQEAVRDLGTAEPAGGVPVRPLRDYLAELSERVLQVAAEPERWPAHLQALQADVRATLAQLLAGSSEEQEGESWGAAAETLQALRIYVARVQWHLDSMQKEMSLLLPWRQALAEPPALPAAGAALPPAVARAWEAVQSAFPANPTWEALPVACRAGDAALEELIAALHMLDTVADEAGGSLLRAEVAPARAWAGSLSAALAQAESMAQETLAACERIGREAQRFVDEMEFAFLFSRTREVFHIGYNVDTGRLDDSYYDLLASEARIASLIAIARNEVPQRHWLRMARPITRTLTGDRSLLSWSGTMFEYLMPPLLMRSYSGTLLGQSYAAVIEHQIAYGEARDVPWGISESGFYAFDAGLGYQYRAFGAPGLGLKRGLADDLVVAPYASLLALPFHPEAVLANIARMKEMGLLGRYGLYEAVDFTPARMTLGQPFGVVRSHMAHHQGMIMLALAQHLDGPRMVERFHAEPVIASVELLLQEQVPPAAPLRFPQADEETAGPIVRAVEGINPWRAPVGGPLPALHYLSNGRYGVLATAAGGGSSVCDGLMLTRWRTDSTLDDWGSWLYAQDLSSGALWSTGRQPVGEVGEHEEAVFHPGRAEFRRRYAGVSLHMDVTVAQDEDVELRRVAVTNESGRARRLGLTSYAEVALAPAGADLRHPAFAKLFVEAEYVAEVRGLLFRKRPRSADEEPRYLLHMLVRGPLGDGGNATIWGRVRRATDRARFLGRLRDARAPAALAGAGWWAQPIADASGAPLDPVFALGQELLLEPHGRAQLAFITISASTRDAALALAHRFQAWTAVEHAFTRAAAQAERELRDLDFAGAQLEHTQQLLSLLLVPHPARRAPAAELAANTHGQSGLWGFGISGDNPILLVRVREEGDTPLIQELLRAHTYWRRRGLHVDLVILNEQDTDYGQELHNAVFRLIRRMDSDVWLNQRGGIFLLRRDQIAPPGLTLLNSAARVVLDAAQGGLAQQMANLYEPPLPLPPFAPVPDVLHELAAEAGGPLPRPAGLQFDNGFGGFSPDGREYVIYLPPGAATPAPWSNVIANPEFGCLVTESGLGATWAVNSGENRLTPWRNDAVSDPPAEAVYLRDEETAATWSPTLQPAPAPMPYLARHGAGYTDYEHRSHALEQRVRVYVAPDAPVKLVQLRLANLADRPRRITATYYAEWVLGVSRDTAQQYVVPEFDEETQALLAQNPYNAEFGERVAFLAADCPAHGWTADRTEFLGRLGSLARPAALERIGLARRAEAGADPCAALQVHVDLPAGGVEEVTFVLGQGATRAEAVALAARFRRPGSADAAWQAVGALWDDLLGAVTVETPDPAMNLLLNRWLPYQTLACRIWGRTAFYQSSGAYGFRDQLQDVLALLWARPKIARTQLLRAAAHQFEAGDVLHWWHPPSGRGVRTRISDDLLWLPYVTARYIAATGDAGVLEERVPFLRGDPLRVGEEERYGHYASTEEAATLLEHCRRALQRGVTAGPHGLPLMGTGDWNDGMNRVGAEGRGESIWLGWFAYSVLQDFAGLCSRAGLEEEAAAHRARAAELHHALETHGWDGAWYRRAYYDDGTPLGSAQNRECRIDSIAQSWAVLSGAPRTARTEQAVQAVLDQLVRWDDGLILLFTPPFDRTPRDPGYIKGYLPGVRENGGQYTHAATWVAWAAAGLGDGDTAVRLFDLLDPIRHTDTPEKARRYVVEPYVVAADIYGAPPHTGRGGWTWYTGSGGWLYRVGIEAILGLRLEGGELRVEPCLPRAWPGFTATVRIGGRVYTVRVARGPAGPQVTVEEGAQAEKTTT